VVAPNLDPPLLVGWLGLAVAAVMAVRALLTVGKRGAWTAERQEAWTVVYLVAWLVVPLLVVYVAFVATGVARYSPRYWLFIMPPLAPLLILTVREAVHLVGLARRRRTGRDLDIRWSVLAAAVVVATLVLPGTLAAADRPKLDWRGAARDIVTIVESNPESRYVVYETAFRSTPVLDYYLSRFSRDVRVTATIRRTEERTGDFSFERTAHLIEGHDFLIVPFIHHRTTDFPNALRRLRELYRVHHWQINESDRGLVIFAIGASSGAGSAPDRSSEEAP
jgi:hypothetical protein